MDNCIVEIPFSASFFSPGEQLGGGVVIYGLCDDDALMIGWGYKL
jgi:hypothetical protein